MAKFNVESRAINEKVSLVPWRKRLEEFFLLHQEGEDVLSIFVSPEISETFEGKNHIYSDLSQREIFFFFWIFEVQYLGLELLSDMNKRLIILWVEEQDNSWENKFMYLECN